MATMNGLKQRNFVVRAKQSGAGKHKDKRQQLKHRELYDEQAGESREEAGDEGHASEAMGSGGDALTDR